MERVAERKVKERKTTYQSGSGISGSSSNAPGNAGVTSLAKEGETGLVGDVTLSEGLNVELTQDGQDIEIAVSENLVDISSIQFDLTPAISSAEGKLYWNDDDKTLNLGLTGGSVLQIGQEIIIRGKNVSGSTINDSSVVYIKSATGEFPDMDLANASKTSGSMTLAVATQNVNNNAYGYFTTFGLVRNINTSSWSAGTELFLDDTNGGLTSDKLSHPNFRIKIGHVVKSHATEGSVFVSIQGSQWLKRFQAMREPTGFDSDQSQLRGDISFVNSTRTFTIEPQSGETYYNYWVAGREYKKTSGETLVITDVEGSHWLYYDANTLTEKVNPSTEEEDDIIRTKALVAFIYWDATNNEYVLFNDERHLTQMDGSTHSWIHFLRSAQWKEGGALNGFSIGTGSSNSDAQFGYSTGIISDEDIDSTETNISSTTGNEILYKSSSNWRRTTQTGYSVLTDVTAGIGSTGRLVYNNSGALAVVGNNDYVLAHIVQTTGVTSGERVFSIIGQATYGDILSARAGAEVERKSLILSGLPGPEVVFLGTVIFQTSNGYSNAVKARIREVEGSVNYIDWRSTPASPGAGSISHPNLANLNAGFRKTGGHDFVCQRHEAATNPTVNDDFPNFDEGDIWVNTTSNIAFICVDSTDGAAVWSALGGFWKRTGTILSPLNTGDSVELNGTATTGSTLKVVRNQSTANAAVVYIHQDSATNGYPALAILQDGTASGSEAIEIKTNGNNARGINILTLGTLARGVQCTTSGDNADGFYADVTGSGANGIQCVISGTCLSENDTYGGKFTRIKAGRYADFDESNNSPLASPPENGDVRVVAGDDGRMYAINNAGDCHDLSCLSKFSHPAWINAQNSNAGSTWDAVSYGTPSVLPTVTASQSAIFDWTNGAAKDSYGRWTWTASYNTESYTQAQIAVWTPFRRYSDDDIYYTLFDNAHIVVRVRVRVNDVNYFDNLYVILNDVNASDNYVNIATKRDVLGNMSSNTWYEATLTVNAAGTDVGGWEDALRAGIWARGKLFKNETEEAKTVIDVEWISIELWSD